MHTSRNTVFGLSGILEQFDFLRILPQYVVTRMRSAAVFLLTRIENQYVLYTHQL